MSDHYTLWHTRHVNPYKVNALKFCDTIPLVLSDEEHTHCSPLDKCEITSRFGMRGYRHHYGTDIRLNTGDTIRAAFDGIVRIKGYDKYGYGQYIMLRHHNHLESLYGHMSKRLVESGQIVKAGDPIGLGGSTGRSSGPHLHFEVRYQGHAINPETLYDFENNSLKDTVFTITPKHFEYIKNIQKRVYYKVRSGDNLGKIARRYHTSVSKICRLNGIRSTTILKVGRKLRVR